MAEKKTEPRFKTANDVLRHVVQHGPARNPDEARELLDGIDRSEGRNPEREREQAEKEASK